MQVGKDKKFPSLYENIPREHYTHTQTLQLPLSNHHTTQISLQKHKYDKNINKAEHGYNIGMHAVNTHPVNNIFKTKQNLLRLNISADLSY